MPRRGEEMGSLGIIENGAILIRAQRIVWVGPTRDIPVREPGVRYQTVDGVGLGLVALPGFVDATPTPYSPERVPTSTNCAPWAKPTRKSPRREEASRTACASCAGPRTTSWSSGRSGTSGSFSRTAPRPSRRRAATASASRTRSRAWRRSPPCRDAASLEIVPTFLGAHAFPEEFRDAREQYVRLLVDEMIPQVARRKLAQFCDVFCDAGYFTVDRGATGAAGRARSADSGCACTRRNWATPAPRGSPPSLGRRARTTSSGSTTPTSRR